MTNVEQEELQIDQVSVALVVVSFYATRSFPFTDVKLKLFTESATLKVIFTWFTCFMCINF